MYGLIVCIVGFIALLAGGIYDRRERISKLYSPQHSEAETEKVEI